MGQPYEVHGALFPTAAYLEAHGLLHFSRRQELLELDSHDSRLKARSMKRKLTCQFLFTSHVLVEFNANQSANHH